MRRGFALLTSVLLVTLMIATAARLAVVSGVETLVAARNAHDLTHTLALDSVLLLVADELSLAVESPLIRELDLHHEARRSYTLGDWRARCRITDDGAKFNPNQFNQPRKRPTLTRKLTTLASQLGLPLAAVNPRPLIFSAIDVKDSQAYFWFDQLLADPLPGAICTLASLSTSLHVSTTWSDVITFFGDGRLDLRRVELAVVEALLDDLEPGLGDKLLSARANDPSVDFTKAALAKVPSELRGRVAERITFDAGRYALQVETSVGPDSRRWYVVVHIDEENLEVLHRSQITW